MAKYIKGYIEEIDELLAADVDLDELIKKHLIKISFFQHERVVHLIVTLTYGFLTVLGFILGNGFNSIWILLIPCLFLCLLIPYIFHYFLLENGVQKMYQQYDKMLEKRG